jgi:multidrug resistance efflux pump
MRLSARAGFAAIVLGTVGLGFQGEAKGGGELDVLSERDEPAAIVSIVPDGTVVQRGQLVCELDSTALKERLTEQDAVTQRAESNLKSATLAREIARLALDEFVEGSHKQDRQAASAQIAMAEGQRKRAEDRLEWANRMLQRGYVARAEVTRAQTILEKTGFALEQAQGRKKTLELSARRKAKELEGDLEKARADEQAAEASCDLERSRQAKIEHQISLCKLLAPEAGKVVYAPTRVAGQPSPIIPGAIVRPRQLVFRLVPTKPAVEATRSK